MVDWLEEWWDLFWASPGAQLWFFMGTTVALLLWLFGDHMLSQLHTSRVPLRAIVRLDYAALSIWVISIGAAIGIMKRNRKRFI